MQVPRQPFKGIRNALRFVSVCLGWWRCLETVFLLISIDFSGNRGGGGGSAGEVYKLPVCFSLKTLYFLKHINKFPMWPQAQFFLQFSLKNSQNQAKSITNQDVGIQIGQNVDFLELFWCFLKTKHIVAYWGGRGGVWRVSKELRNLSKKNGLMQQPSNANVLVFFLFIFFSTS